MFQIFLIISSEWNFGEIIYPLTIVVIVLIYMLLSNYIAQCVTEHNKQVFATV